MNSNIQKRSWEEREKYQLLLAYRIGVSIHDIANILGRSEKSIYRALERFRIILPGTPKGRPRYRDKASRYNILELEQLFRDCGLSLDPLFDKGFFVKYNGQVSYQPSLDACLLWKKLNVKIETPWLSRKAHSPEIGKYLRARRTKEYTLQDLLQFMNKSGKIIKQIELNGQKYFFLKDQKYTPLSLLYFANKMRLQKGLEMMCIPGITQD